MSNNDSSTDERRRSWIGIVLALLLVCGCLSLVLGPGMPVVRNVLGSSLTATPDKREVTRNPVEEPTKTNTPTGIATENATPEDRPASTNTPDTPAGNGACLDPCDPDNSTCLAGLACVPHATGSEEYICYNRTICELVVTEVPSVTEQPVCMCGDGICEQDRCNELQQNCPADCGSAPTSPPPPPRTGPVCGDRVCNGNETCDTCSTDCGLC